MNEPSRYCVSFADGAHAEVATYALGVLHLVCDRAYPPGQPLAFTLSLGESQLDLQGKSAGSKRRPDQRFDVRIRLSSLRREARSQLEQALGPLRSLTE